LTAVVLENYIHWGGI